MYNKAYVSERNALYLYKLNRFNIYYKWYALDKLYVFACGAASVLYAHTHV